LIRFANAYSAYLESEIRMYDLTSSKTQRLIVVSRACFQDEYYLTDGDTVSILALGHWDRVMAPPSLVEVILMLVVSCSIFALPESSDLSHYGTKGCLFDFNADLSNARFMALQGFVCSECRSKLQKCGYADLSDDLNMFLGKKWLGQIADPTSPAGIASKLGYDLFVTKGLTPRWSEKLLSALKEDGVKEMTKVGVGTLVALLLGFLGIKEITRSSDPASTQMSPSPAPVQVPKVSPTAYPNE
jgi:hypothetical protein